jgi:O-antigen ligase
VRAANLAVSAVGRADGSWAAPLARAGLYTLVLFAVGRMNQLMSFPANTVLIIVALTVVLALMTSPPDRNPLWRQREVQLVLALSALAVLSAPLGVWPGGSMRFLRNNYGPLPVFFALIVVLATSARVIQNLVWSLLLGIGVLGIFTIGGSAAVSGRAAAGTIYDPNDTAMIMVLTLPLAAFAAVGLRGVGRVVAAGVVVVCVLATIMTVSRGGFVGLAFICVLLLFRLGTARLAPRLMILGATVALLAVAAPAQYWTRMSTIWNPTGGKYDQTGVFSRVEVWQQGLRLFMENAVIGVGVGMYEAAEGLSHGGRGKWSAAHNSFIQIATELGIGGLVLFLCLLVLSIRNARRVLHASRETDESQQLGWVAAALEISLYAYIVLGFALSQAYSAMLFFLLAITTALRLQVEGRRAIETRSAAREAVRAR